MLRFFSWLSLSFALGFHSWGRSLLHFCEHGIEPPEVRLPDAAITFRPVGYLPDGLRLESTEILPAIALAFDEVRVLEIGQVLGDSLLRNGERPGQFENRRWPGGETIDDRSPSWIGQGSESGAQGIHNHMVVYVAREVKRENWFATDLKHVTEARRLCRHDVISR